MHSLLQLPCRIQTAVRVPGTNFNIYQSIAAQIEEVQGDDLKELSKIAKATIKYAINDVPAKKRKRIEEYLDYMSDGNLAYKYGEYPQWQYPDELK